MKNLDGDKAAQTKISKIAHSANVRTKRIHDFSDTMNSAFCNECGFRVRGKNHLEGAHHNGRVAECRRG